jgi:hypothetical protein
MNVFDPDLFRSASHRHMAAHLTTPFAGGAVDSPVPVDANAVATVAWQAREPLLLIAPLSSLESESFVVTASDNGADLDPVTFAPYTEAGAFLPLYTPPVDPEAGTAAAFALTLAVQRVAPDGTAVPVVKAAVSGLFELRLLEGVLGRVAYALGAEKQRIRRTAREIAGMRTVSRARDDALDRTGADFGVPRFSETIEYDTVRKQIVTRTRREPDDEYRRRLGIYRLLWSGTYGRVDRLLNGPNPAPAPNRSVLHDLDATFEQRFDVTEKYNPFAVAVHLVESGGGGHRQRFLDYVRSTRLTWPLNEPDANDAHSRRYLPAAQKEAVEKLRRELRGFYAFQAGAALGPVLCDALARVGRVRAALGVATQWPLKRAQKSDGGSRYELGLGADIAMPIANELDTLHGALADPNRVANADAEVEALLLSLKDGSKSSADDPEGRWLLVGCGLQTVHRIDATTLYVSHLPVFGLLMDGPSTAPLIGWDELVAGYWQEQPGFVAYERSSGAAQFYTIGTDGSMSPLGQPQNLGAGWRLIAAGQFTGGWETDLALYNPDTGESETWSFDGKTAQKVGATRTGWRTTWTVMATGNFGSGSDTWSDLLLYDPTKGELEFVQLSSGGYQRIGSVQTGQGRRWTHIVPGIVLNDWFQTGALFYDASAGVVELGQVVAPGRLHTVWSSSDFRRRWSHVLAGSFSSSGSWEYLFYDRETGEAEIYAVGDDGLVRLAVDATWPGDWTQAVTVWSWRGVTDVLAYDRLLDRVGTFGRDEKQQTLTFAPRATMDFGRNQQPQTFTGHFYAAESQDSNVILHEGLVAAAAAWTGAGHEAWTVLAKNDGTAAWDAAIADGGARHIFEDAGLPGVVDPAPVVGQLKLVDPDLLDTIELGPTLSQAVLGGGGANDLRALAETLRDNDVSSALPLSTTVAGNPRIVIVTGVTGLPGAGLNLSERRAAGFRWYAIPMAGFRGELRAAGSAAAFTAVDDGLTAIVLIGYARRGALADPYQFTVDLPDGAALSLLQYEFVMNLLDYAHPVGIGVNTYAIRQRHVKLNGGVAPLPPRIARTFRPFRRPRGRGEVARTVSVSAPPAGAAWLSAGGVITAPQAVAANADGRLAVFAPTTGGSVRTIAQTVAGGDLGGWSSLGGGVIGGVVAIANADGRLDVFGCGTDAALWHNTQGAPNGVFAGWQSLGGTLPGPFAVGRNRDGRLEAFAEGTDTQLWHTWQTAPGGGWSGWTSLGGSVDGLLAVASNQDGRVFVAARRSDGSVWKIEQTLPNGWDAWSSLGGSVVNVLAIGANADGHLEIFGGSPDADLRHAWQTGPNAQTWSAWASLQGEVGTALAVARSGQGVLEVAAARTDNGVEVVSQAAPNGGWGPWSDLGGTASRYSALVANADGRLELFVRGNDSALWHLAQGADSWNG